MGRPQTFNFFTFFVPVQGLGAFLIQIGVRDLVARGYFIPGGASQRGGGQAPMFPCRTLSDLEVSWTQVNHL